jgi:hypothetical protein
VEVVGADHGGGVRSAGGGSLHARLRCGRRKKTAGWAVWAKRPDGSAGPFSDWVES